VYRLFGVVEQLPLPPVTIPVVVVVVVDVGVAVRVGVAAATDIDGMVEETGTSVADLRKLL
jgi:hypothetical protein